MVERKIEERRLDWQAKKRMVELRNGRLGNVARLRYRLQGDADWT